MTSRRQTFLALAVALLGLGWAGPGRADLITYDVSANTSSVTGQTGSLDFQFNPNSFPTLDMDIAQITGFTSDGVVGAVNTPPTQGDVNGDLSNQPVTLKDDTATNELNQTFTYGSQLSFKVTIQTFPGTDGPSFSFIMYDQNGNPINPGPNGVSAVEIDAAPGTGTLGMPQSGSGVTVTPEGGAAPEPTSAVLLGLAGLGVAGWAWRQRGARRKT